MTALGCFARLLLGLITLIGLLIIAGVTFQAVTSRADARRFPPPGQLYPVSGGAAAGGGKQFQMHIHCLGESREGRPTVLLDAHNGGSVSNWIWIQPELAQTTRACAYDRDGLGWSELSPQPLDTRQNAAALHALLQAAGVPGPYVLVGHSFGGLYARAFADAYPDEVAGMVLIEATNPDFLKVQGKPDVMPGADANMIASGPIASRLGLLRLLKFFRGDPDLPQQQRQELDAYYASMKFTEMIKRQYELFPTLLEQVRLTGSLGDIPLAVVLGSDGDGGNASLTGLFAGQAALSTNSVTCLIDGANHISLVDNQAHAAQARAAILQVVEAAQTGQPVRCGP